MLLSLLSSTFLLLLHLNCIVAQNTDSSLALFWTDFCCEESIDQRVWSMEVLDTIYDSRLKIGDVEKSVVNV